MVLSANQLLGRDEKGEQVPVEVQVEGLPGTILVTLISRGELLRIRSDLVAGNINPDEIDFHHIEKHLVKPKLTIDEIRELPIPVIGKVIDAIMSASGLRIADKAVKDAVSEAEDELRKK